MKIFNYYCFLIYLNIVYLILFIYTVLNYKGMEKV